jgi:DoxX-like family
MPSGSQTVPVSKRRLWTGRIMSAIPIAMLLFSGVMKLMKPAPVVQGFAHYGYAESLIPVIGMLELACTILYAIPRTSVLGAILVAGYLGGATATNVRVGDASFFVTLLLGVLAWGGLYLGDERVRALIPLRNDRGIEALKQIETPSRIS